MPVFSIKFVAKSSSSETFIQCSLKIKLKRVHFKQDNGWRGFLVFERGLVRRLFCQIGAFPVMEPVIRD